MKHIPMRTCIVCRAQKDKAELLRIVKGADGKMTVDRSGKAAGRGAYVCDCAECKNTLVNKRVLDKVFKTKLDRSVYDDIAAMLGDAQ